MLCGPPSSSTVWSAIGRKETGVPPATAPFEVIFCDGTRAASGLPLREPMTDLCWAGTLTSAEDRRFVTTKQAYPRRRRPNAAAVAVRRCPGGYRRGPAPTSPLHPAPVTRAGRSQTRPTPPPRPPPPPPRRRGHPPG